MTTLKRALKYRRVSTDEQGRSGFSLDAQDEAINRFCDFNNLTIAGDYLDDGYSAKSMDRPALQRLFREARKGDVIIVYKLDRLTRSSKDLEFLLDLSEKGDLYFRSSMENIETSTPSGRMFVRSIIQFAQFERETIAERTAMGRKQQALNGYFAGSVPPFGYTFVESTRVKRGRTLKALEPDLATSHVVPMIYERYLAGYGARTLARWLNDEINVRTARGNRFNATAVTWILRNPVYVGESVIRHQRKAVAQRIPGTHSALIDEAIFNAVQRMFEVRASLPPRTATGEFPLAGIAHCGECGGKLAGNHERVVRNRRRTDAKYRVYRCHNRVSGRGCRGPAPFSSISADIAERLFVEAMESHIRTNEDFDAFFADCQGETAHAASTIDAEIERLKNELSDCQTAIAQWDAKFEKRRISDDEHEEKVAPHRERIRTIKARLGELEATKPALVEKETMKAIFVSLRDSWDGLDAPARKALVQRLVIELPIRIVVYRGRRVEVQAKQGDVQRSSSLQSQAGE